MIVDLRLVAPAVAAWASAFLLVAWPEGRAVAVVVLWVGALGALGAAIPASARRGALAALSSCAVASALVATAVSVHGAVRQPESVLSATAGNRHAVAIVRLDGNPAAVSSGGFSGTLDPRLRVRGTMMALRIGDERLSLAVPVLVFVPNGFRGDPGDVRDPRIGAVVRVSGTLKATAPEDDVAFLVFARGSALVLEPPPRSLRWANDLRSGFADAATALPGDGGALLPGLAIGDTSAVDERLDTAMKASSLSHLTAVSGANCAVVVAAVMMLGAGLRWRRSVRSLASVLALGGFVLLVTPEPSVLRAAVMATIVLGAFASGRPGRGVPALALAVLALVTIDPWLSRNYGFVLSVLATAGLLVLSGPLTDALARLLPRSLAAIVALPVAAQLACQPVLILLAPSIPLYGVPANVLAAPAAPVATMAGLVACLLLPVAPALGTLVAQLAWLPAAWIASVASFMAGLPGSRLPWLEGALGLSLLAAVSGVAVAVALPGRSSGRRSWRVPGCALLATGLGVYAGSLLGTTIRDRISIPPDWQYAACDVGQGDAVLVNGRGKVALVDVGPDAALLEECLDRLGIGRIDLLVLTHYDFDHVGGVAAVIGRADAVLAGPPVTADDSRILERLRAGGARITTAARGMTGTLGVFSWRVLWPKPTAAAFATGNDGSVTMSFAGTVECHPVCLTSIFLGDLGETAQTAMVAANRLEPVDVVKVAHHGSADQSIALYDRLDASIGIVSVGADNTYGHPTDALLGILARSGTALVRTDVQGHIVLGAGAHPGELAVWSERPLPESRAYPDPWHP